MGSDVERRRAEKETLRLAGMKRCHRCHETQPVSGFYKQSQQPDGLHPYCKRCCFAVSVKRRTEKAAEIRAQELASREADPERWQARNRSRRHARKARKLSAEVTGPVPRAVYAEIMASGPCVYCAEPATTVDHVWPLARGGHEHPTNLVPACGPCNFSKHTRLLPEWDPVRVAHGVRVSAKVAAVWVRQLAEAA